MRVIVIGSGFGGLSAAIRLRAAGHDVTVVEKRDKPGGRAYVYERDGFTTENQTGLEIRSWMTSERERELLERWSVTDGAH